MARRVPQAQFAVIPQAGHMVPFERPGETAAAIDRFLSAV
jgi:pimeloyl-ACP methyl ester carboxylesterase